MPPTDPPRPPGGSDRAGPLSPPPAPAPRVVGDGGVPEAGGVDLQPDVERIHRAIRREPHDPIEGRERAPWFFTAAILLALFWGGWYLGRFGGEWGTATHVAYAARQPGIAAAAAGQNAAAIENPVAAGKVVYENNCKGCHQGVGEGVPGVFPPLVGSEWVTGSPELVVSILLHGLQGPVQVEGVTYNGAMPAWQDVLQDAELAAVATYIRQLEGNDAPAVPVEVVTRVREAETSRTTPWTAEELERLDVSGAGAPSPASVAVPDSTAAIPASAGGPP